MNVLDYRIIKDLNLVIEVICGTLQLEKYFDLKHRIINDAHYQSNTSNKFIIDLSDAEVNRKSDQIRESTKKYLDEAKKIKNLSPLRKSALIAKTPDQVVATTIYKMINNLPVEVGIFASIPAACSWLGIGEGDAATIEGIISEIKRG